MDDVFVSKLEQALGDREFWTERDILVDILGYEREEITKVSRARVKETMEYLGHTKRKPYKVNGKWLTGWEI